jgi:hypothetical protein
VIHTDPLELLKRQKRPCPQARSMACKM